MSLAKIIETIRGKPINLARELAAKYNKTLRVVMINDTPVYYPVYNNNSLDIAVRVPYEPMIENEDGTKKWNPRLRSEKNGAIVIGFHKNE